MQVAVADEFEDDSLPTESMSLDDLASYVRDRLGMAHMFMRKTAVQLWLAGDGLSIVKRRLRVEHPGRYIQAWAAWLEQNNFRLTTANNLVKIRESFDSLEEIGGYTPMQAKILAGVVKEKDPAPPNSSATMPKAPRSTVAIAPTNPSPPGTDGEIEVDGGEGEAEEPAPTPPSPPSDQPPIEPIPADPETESAINAMVDKAIALIETVGMSVDRVRPRHLDGSRIRKAISELHRILDVAGDGA